MTALVESANEVRANQKAIKCVVWDLDNTLWNGVLLEDQQVALRENVAHIVETLDSRGILQSIASRNEHRDAMAKLEEFRLGHYFLYPQINWNSKSASIRTIAKSINIGLNTVAFIDDQQFEREEVNFSLPEVLSLDANESEGLLDRPEMNPRFVTEDSKLRRQMYRQDQQRKKAEDEFTGTREDFLAGLKMVFTISPAREEDLQRVEELTVRANQLNATGHTYGYDELNAFRRSEKHLLLVAGLTDKYGRYGKIGLALVECLEHVWTIKLLIVSCRVMSRGVGTIVLHYIMAEARKRKVRLLAEFVPTGLNRLMYVAYKFAGFKEVEKGTDVTILEDALIHHAQPFPDYVKVNIVD